MVIDEFLLEAKGASVVEYDISDFIFLEDDIVRYYYQIVTGKVKLNNYTDTGKEILQSIIDEGHSIGEYLLFLNDIGSPVNAVAVTRCKILKLSKASFLELLREQPNLGLDINRNISEHIHFRHIINNSSTQCAAQKLKTLLDFLKIKHNKTEPYSFLVPLTRQEMANFTGLCVETTIKTLKKMEREKLVRIVNRKIYY